MTFLFIPEKEYKIRVEIIVNLSNLTWKVLN
jgi:hypothetical protein